MKIQSLIIGAAIGYFLAKQTSKPCECGQNPLPGLPFSGQNPVKTTVGGMSYFHKHNAMVAGRPVSTNCKSCANGSQLFPKYTFSSDSERVAFLTA